MPIHSTVRARLKKVNVPKVVALRKALGWSQEDLALAIDMDPKTIQSMEAGNGKYHSTVLKVAKALGVEDFNEILLPDQREETLRWVKPSKTVRLIIDIARELFDESGVIEIVARIGKASETQDDMITYDVIKHSISIFIEMSQADAMRIISSFIGNRLQHHDITSITILPPPPPKPRLEGTHPPMQAPLEPQWTPPQDDLEPLTKKKGDRPGLPKSRKKPER